MLLATDLDGTFLSGDSDDRQTLYHLIANHPDIQLAFVTGRGLESVLPLLADPSLPQPDYIICDVGCTVVDGNNLQPLQPLQSQIDQDWPGTQSIEAALAHIPSLIRQDVPQERRCSYFCDSEDISMEVRRIVKKLDCDLLFSAQKYLDVLPKGVNKGSTLLKLTQHLGIDEENVLVAGDTLNDLSMFSHAFVGVCVGESEDRLLQATERCTRTFHAESPGCGGILEAISYFGFLGAEGVAAESRDEHSTGKSNLVMVYHRLPFEERVIDGKIAREMPSSPNGILPTLLSFFSAGQKGSWIAWSQLEPDTPGFKTHTPIDADKYENLQAVRVPLTKSDVDIFYRQFSKEAFWPTLHTFWERASFREDHWQVFLEVNRKFAEQAAKEAAPNALVWIHDYNLWMVPAFLREIRQDLRIAFFHHTYFPSADVFNVLPWRHEIVGSLLQCDYIGFHIPRQAENFVDVARGVMPVVVKEKVNCAPRFVTYGCAVGLDEMTQTIQVNDRIIQLGAHPVGIDLKRIETALANPDIQASIKQLKADIGDVKTILSVERLDYTKGILEKLRAFEEMLENHPELHTQVTLITICVPAAKEMTVYQELQTQIEQAVGRINGRFGRVGWTPLQFFFRSFPFEQLVAYYYLADVMWITPLRDGLNLVSKEFIATQGMTEQNGVLVLSEFAGAAAELRGAILTNPHDRRDLANRCYQALTMDEAEASSRIKEAYDIVSYYDVERWGDEFISAVNNSCKRSPQKVA